MTAAQRYAELVEREAPWQAGRTPTRSFAAAMTALHGLESTYAAELARTTGQDPAGALRMLLRMRRLGLVTAEVRRPVGQRRRTCYTLTAAGAVLARAFADEAVR